MEPTFSSTPSLAVSASTPKISRVIVTGSLAFDYIMSMPGQFKDHIMADKIHAINVSFIMETFRKEFGGTGGNIAYSLSQLTVPTFLVGSAGYDFGEYMKHLQTLGAVDVSGVQIVEDVPTAQGFVMTDRDDNQIWGLYEGAMRREEKLSLKDKLKPGDLVIIAPNNPKAVVRYINEAIAAGIPYVYDPAFNISHFSAADMEQAVKGPEIVVGNDYEIEMIRRALRWPDADFFDPKRVVITTLGPKGSIIRKGTQEFSIPVAKVADVTDPTGAGDAYRAGFIAGYIRGLDLEICGKIAAVSSAYAVEQYGTQNFTYTLEQFVERFHENFDDELVL